MSVPFVRVTSFRRFASVGFVTRSLTVLVLWNLTWHGLSVPLEARSGTSDSVSMECAGTGQHGTTWTDPRPHTCRLDIDGMALVMAMGALSSVSGIYSSTDAECRGLLDSLWAGLLSESWKEWTSWDIVDNEGAWYDSGTDVIGMWKELMENEFVLLHEGTHQYRYGLGLDFWNDNNLADSNAAYCRDLGRLLE